MSYNAFSQIFTVAERLHRGYLDAINIELATAKVFEINSQQAMILFNIGEDEPTVSELTLKGCYLGSNVSYNLKKLRELGFIEQIQSEFDKRVYRVKLTQKGLGIAGLIERFFDQQVERAPSVDLTHGALDSALASLNQAHKLFSVGNEMHFSR